MIIKSQTEGIFNIFLKSTFVKDLESEVDFTALTFKCFKKKNTNTPIVATIPEVIKIIYWKASLRSVNVV